MNLPGRFFSPFIFLLLIFALPLPSAAHPLDELGDIELYDQKQIISLDRESIELKIEMKFFAYEKTVVWETIDTNKDRQLSQDEKNDWMQLGRDSSWIIFNGNKYTFEPREIVIADYFDFFTPPPTTMTLIYGRQVALPGEGTLEYHYRGSDKKLEEIQLEFKGTNNLIPLSTSKISANHVQIKFGPLNSLNNNDLLQNFLNRYIKTSEEIPFSLQIWVILIASTIGALHAFTPGHGKAMTAGFLIGEQGTIWHALNQGAIITFTHSFSVFALGLAALLLTQYIIPDTIIKWLHFLSGLLVLILGLYLVYLRSKKILNSKFLVHNSGSQIHTIYQHPSHHQIQEHSSHHAHLSHRHLIPLGIAGGIVPRVDALAILIVAVSLNKIVFGLLVLVSFSFGLATVLVARGIFVVIAKNKAAKKFQHLTHLEPYLNLASAVVVTLLGILLLLNS